MMINYARLPFGLRRPRITSNTPQYGLWNKTGDWAQDGMAHNNIYWNYGEFLNDWSSGELTNELMEELLDNPQDWAFCGDCSEGPKGDQDGFIRLKDWSDPDAHTQLEGAQMSLRVGGNPELRKQHLENIATVPTPNKDYVTTTNQMDMWWPFYHLTGPTGIAEKAYTDLEYKVNGTEDDIYPFQSRMWWYFEPRHERDMLGRRITYKFDRERFAEDVLKGHSGWSSVPQNNTGKPITPSQMAIIDSFSKYDSVLDISKKEISTPALGRTSFLENYKVVKNPDKNARCIMPGCSGKVKVDGTWENTCKYPLMIQ